MFKTLLCTFLILVILPHAVFAQHQSAYDRMIETGTLRCGYASWKPMVYQDLKTGEMQGIMVDLLNEIASFSDIKIDWVAEVDWGQINTALKNQKIDAFCSGMWNDAKRGKFIGYTTPLLFMPVDIFVMEDDTRFPKTKLSIDDVNKAEFSVAYTEGDIIETIAKTELPNVKGVPLPLLGSPADNILHMLTGKTDMVINAQISIQNFQQQNPDKKIRALDLETKIGGFGDVLGVDIHERELISFLNAAIHQLINSGKYDIIINKYLKEYPSSVIPQKKMWD